MLFNAVLAFIPIIIVVILRRRSPLIPHLLFFFFWLIFLPNTIYLITDLQHLPFQLLRAQMGEQLLLLLQYSLLTALGVMTYVYSLEPISVIFKRLKFPEIKKEILYIGINYVISFGVILGKVQRTHSWYIFTEPGKVVSDIYLTISNINLLTWVFVFGSIVNIVFFLFKDYFPPLRSLERKKRK